MMGNYIIRGPLKFFFTHCFIKVALFKFNKLHEKKKVLVGRKQQIRFQMLAENDQIRI